MKKNKRIFCMCIVLVMAAAILVPSISMAQDEISAASGANEMVLDPLPSPSSEAAMEAPAPVVSAVPTPTATAAKEQTLVNEPTLLSAAAPAIPDPRATQTVSNVFPDTALAQKIADKLGKADASAPVTQNELDTITELRADDCGITDLTGIGQLTNLEILGLQSNGLRFVPDEIANLSLLRELELSNRNYFTDFPLAVCRLGSLERLDISNVGLTSLPPEIGDLTNLKFLVLSNNKLKSIPAEYGDLVNLEAIYLDHNELTSLPTEISRLQNTVHVSLENNALKSLPEEITQLRNVENVNLSYNQLTELPGSIGNMRRLNYLMVSHNQLSSLPDSLWNVGIQTLHLSNNLFAEFPEVITELSSLKYLYLNENQLTELPETIGYLDQLEQIYADDNAIGFLPESLEILPNCAIMSFKNNQLTELPLSIAFMPALRELYINGNHLVDVSMVPGILRAFDAKDQYVTIYDYRKDTAYPYRYTPSGTALWDRGYEENEVKANDFYSGKTFKMTGNPAHGKIEGPSGEFSINYTIDLKSALMVTVEPKEVTLGVGEMYLFQPESNVLNGFDVDYTVSVDQGAGVISIAPNGYIMAIEPGYARVTIKGNVAGTDIYGETACIINVLAGEGEGTEEADASKKAAPKTDDVTLPTGFLLCTMFACALGAYVHIRKLRMEK